MTAFEFYLSFYGLLLGLSVAQVASGLGHALVIRRESHTGWLTPLLATFLLVDITSFWMWAWNGREVVTVSYASVYVGLIIALAYYLASILLFPVRESDWTDLDQHYWRNKRLVLIGIGIANIIILAEATIRRGTSPFSTTLSWSLQAAYWGSMLLMLLSKKKRLDGICLAVLVGTYALTALLI